MNVLSKSLTMFLVFGLVVALSVSTAIASNGTTQMVMYVDFGARDTVLPVSPPLPNIKAIGDFFATFDAQSYPIANIPEPTTAIMMVVSFLSIAVYNWRRRK